MNPAYPVATAAAARIHPHFAAHSLSPGSAPAPDRQTIEALIDAAFWTSLRREEGYVPRVSLAFIAPHHVAHPLTFEHSIALSPSALTRIAPAVERPGIHLGVRHESGELRVWGASRALPAHCFVLEVIAPGVLVVKHNRAEDAGKFVNVAVIQGDRIKVIDQHAASVPDCPSLVTSLLGLDTQFAAPRDVNILIQLAVSMRNHGRGGLLLVPPAESETWKESVLQPISYSVSPPFSALAELMRIDEPRQRNRSWEDALRRAVDAVGGLTAVDGATVIDTNYELLAFGAKIVRRRAFDIVPRVIVTEPVEGSEAVIADPSQIGGTRHLSAAQFAHDQRDAVTLVASQDGRFTVFGWSPCDRMVHAHHIESLLL
jgi:hypothetical protein